MFLRTHRGFGTPVVMQGLWRGGDIEPSDLVRVHAALAQGPLSRSVIRPSVPGARPRWQPGAAPWPIEWAPATVPRDAVVAWADTVAARPVDPESGAGWRLAAARLDGGGTALSLVCSHVVADARGLATVLAAAVTGTPAPSEDPPSHRVRDDVADAARMITGVGARTVRAVAGLVRHPSRRAELRSAPVSADPPDRADLPAPATESLITDIDADRWDAEAARAGGTPNSLLVAVAVGIAASGAPGPRWVGVPVDRRHDPRIPGNAVDMVELAVRPGDSPAAVRDLLRAAYARPPMSSPAGFPPELLQLVPDAVAHRLAPDPGERDVLCSNIGAVPAALATIGGAGADAVATRAVHPGITADRMAASRNRLSAYLCRLGGRYTLALVSKDPGLRERAATELARRGLTGRQW